jgi:endonuclease IV
MRVRQIINLLTAKQKRDLIKLLPSETGTYEDFVGTRSGLAPSMIKTVFEENFPGMGSSLIGIIAEELLKFSTIGMKEFGDVTVELSITKTQLERINKSKTTHRFFNSILETRKLLGDHLIEIGYDVELVSEEFGIEGHPDLINDQIIFEVKTVTNLKKDWNDYLLQLFAYSALSPKQEYVCLVLPLQEAIYPINVENWKNRREFLAILTSKIPTVDTIRQRHIQQMVLIKYKIGMHITKQPKLLNTVTGLDPELPYQIMLSGNISCHIKVKDDDLAATFECISNRKINMFIHASYTINLGRSWNDPKCRQHEDVDGSMEGFHISALRKQIRAARAMGAKGVVVHLGNHVEHERNDAIRYMWENINLVLDECSIDCPLLLETGVGEKTELVWKQEEFVGFLDSISDPRLAVCLDTAHVHAAGYDITSFLAAVQDRLRLVHYNDCKSAKGSHRDLHEIIGGGTIPFESLIEVAEICSAGGIPMLRE